MSSMPEQVVTLLSQASPEVSHRRKARTVYAPPTAETIATIRALDEKGVSIEVLARRFELSWPTIRRIVGGVE